MFGRQRGWAAAGVAPIGAKPGWGAPLHPAQHAAPATGAHSAIAPTQHADERRAEAAAQFATLAEQLAEMRADLDTLVAHAPKTPIDRLITIGAPTSAAGGTAYKLATLEYRYNRVWVAATATLLVNTMGTNTSIDLVPGWNELGLIDGSELSIASGTLNAILRLADWKA